MEGNFNFIFDPSNTAINAKAIKEVFIILITYYSNFKIMNRKITADFKFIRDIFIIIIFSIICGIIRYKANYLISIMSSVLVISIIFNKDNIKNGILTTIISMSINYIISFVTVIIDYIFVKMIKIDNDYINLMVIIICHVIILSGFFRLKRFKYGISFLKKEKRNEYMDIFILNISVTILFSTIIFVNSNILGATNVAVGIITFAIIMFITIQKSLQLYYKQKLLIQELNETKEELENTKKELKQVEEENLEFSKKSHTLAHRQKSLEHKIQELVTKTEISTEEAGEVKDRLKEIEKDLYKETATVELSKTEVSEIDDMLKYMQSECIKNKIEFELQLAGNIHYMTNNLISKEDLEILLADHIKDAIIAINHTDNINRSILVRLGEIDGLYSLYIYDSGIEFEIETLKNLGKKPSTTHADEGGTGMGFMNTFDTLRKYKASLTINELSKSNKDNYTKVIIFKFDKKNDFKIISYRQEELS